MREYPLCYYTKGPQGRVVVNPLKLAQAQAHNLIEFLERLIQSRRLKVWSHSENLDEDDV